MKDTLSKEQRPNVDTSSYELAEHFLQDVKDRRADDVWNLAAAIQNAVEGWFEDTWCIVCGGRDEHKPGCRDGEEVL